MYVKLYAVYRDGELYKASFKHPSPFYEKKKGAEMAIQAETNCRHLPLDYLFGKMKMTNEEQTKYLKELKSHFTIHEFELIDKGVIE